MIMFVVIFFLSLSLFIFFGNPNLFFFPPSVGFESLNVHNQKRLSKNKKMEQKKKSKKKYYLEIEMVNRSAFTSKKFKIYELRG